jgi:hypothetical protein
MRKDRVYIAKIFPCFSPTYYWLEYTREELEDALAEFVVEADQNNSFLEKVEVYTIDAVIDDDGSVFMRYFDPTIENIEDDVRVDYVKEINLEYIRETFDKKDLKPAATVAKKPE